MPLRKLGIFNLNLLGSCIETLAVFSKSNNTFSPSILSIDAVAALLFP